MGHGFAKGATAGQVQSWRLPGGMGLAGAEPEPVLWCDLDETPLPGFC